MDNVISCRLWIKYLAFIPFFFFFLEELVLKTSTGFAYHFGALVTMSEPFPTSRPSTPLEATILKLTNHQISLGKTVQSMTQKFDELLLRFPPLPFSPSSTPQPTSTLSPVPATQHRMKLDIPRFDGTNPFRWVFKINQYFQYHATPEHDRITIISFYMDGRALIWF